jgi:hypothetical protein
MPPKDGIEAALHEKIANCQCDLKCPSLGDDSFSDMSQEGNTSQRWLDITYSSAIACNTNNSGYRLNGTHSRIVLSGPEVK